MKGLMAEWGIPGYEDRIAARLREALTPFTDDIRIDKIGNLIAKIEGKGTAPRKSVMLAAHMDEIGLMVTKIEPQGFLRVTRLGGVDPRTQVAQEVMVHTKSGDYVGIVGSKPPHLTSKEERDKAWSLDELFIDIGMPEEMVREKVSVGDPVTIRREPMELQFDRISGKALDNRASIASVLECVVELQNLEHSVDVYVVGTVQEERGRVGAGQAVYGVQPDIGIAIDVTFGEMPGSPSDATFPLGSGPAIAVGPNIHRKITKGLTETAERLEMAYTFEFLEDDTGTDAWVMQVQRAGVPTGLVSIPLRYMHTSVETVRYSDIQEVGKLLAHYIAGIDAEYVEGLSCYLKD
ncbi:aminopeptidase [Tumebacillus algifaecis]|uniref:Aminopeptidase n=2 Tax=Tumebacillus algifaecis TaxID=1214604 RepID=A0A223D6H4_9BACL|nr:aminopeptidase [Tumebacillus algifaecis]